MSWDPPPSVPMLIDPEKGFLGYGCEGLRLGRGGGMLMLSGKPAWEPPTSGDWLLDGRTYTLLPASLRDPNPTPLRCMLGCKGCSWWGLELNTVLHSFVCTTLATALVAVVSEMCRISSRAIQDRTQLPCELSPCYSGSALSDTLALAHTL